MPFTLCVVICTSASQFVGSATGLAPIDGRVVAKAHASVHLLPPLSTKFLFVEVSSARARVGYTMAQNTA